MNDSNRTRVDDVSDGNVEFRVFDVSEERCVGDETFNVSETVCELDIGHSHVRTICAVLPISSSLLETRRPKLARPATATSS